MCVCVGGGLTVCIKAYEQNKVSIMSAMYACNFIINIYIYITILRGPCSIHIYDSDITFKSCRGCEVVDYCASDSDTPVHVNMCLCP